jgi:FlgD Ig-like domain
MHHRFLPVLIGFVLGAALLPAVATADIHVAVTPPLNQVQPNEEFTLELTVTGSFALFNAFDATVEFDPAVLEFVPEVPLSLQEGALMIGVCGATFHRFSATGDSLVITDVLLCPAQALTGPGQIYRLRFRALETPASTSVRLRPGRTKFYNAGLYVLPVFTEDASVQVGDLVDAGTPGAPQGLSLRARPNPARAGTTLRIAAPEAGPQSVSIYDTRGRVVRAFPSAFAAAGERDLAWDGRDQFGRKVSIGNYTVVLRAGDRKAVTRVTVVHS